jgi:prepilin-type N-terminal cleavage/methylation domain-containing protein
MVRILPAGNSINLGREKIIFQDSRGFTLIELAVVIILIGLMISLAIPRFQYGILTDNLKQTTRRMIGTINSLRSEAVREHKGYLLHFDLESNRFWIDSTDMTEEERARASEKASIFPKGVRVLDVWVAGKGKAVAGETVILFNRKGYVSYSVIHLGSEDSREFTLVLSPFLGRVKVFEKYVDFVDM